MTAIRTNIQPTSANTPILPGGLGGLLNRLVDRWVADIIARREREATRIALRQLDDRKLKDVGIYRHQLGDAFTGISGERIRLQWRGRAG